MTDITKLPPLDSGKRPETGPMQFGTDWPGVFFRGDDALFAALAIAHAVEVLQTLAVVNGTDAYILLTAQLTGLAQDMHSCSVGNTGWPPTPPDDVLAKRDAWLARFEARKQDLIDNARMSAEDAEEVALREVRREIREGR